MYEMYVESVLTVHNAGIKCSKTADLCWFNVCEKSKTSWGLREKGRDFLPTSGMFY